MSTTPVTPDDLTPAARAALAAADLRARYYARSVYLTGEVYEMVLGGRTYRMARGSNGSGYALADTAEVTSLTREVTP